MDYVVYKRFRGKGIGGEFNLRYGTLCRVTKNIIHAPDGRPVCVTTSENGWKYFRPNTTEGAERQQIIDALRKYYRTEKAQPYFERDIYWRELKPEENDYWLHQLRTMPAERIRELYQKRIGGNTRVSD